MPRKKSVLGWQLKINKIEENKLHRQEKTKNSQEVIKAQ